MKKFDCVYSIKKEIEKDLFLRYAIFCLVKDEGSPQNILDLKICDVINSSIEVVECTCDATVNYSGSVGYDREERYREYNEGRKEYVKKTRTITDWAPHSGTIQTTVIQAHFNGDRNLDIVSLFPSAINDVDSNSVAAKGKAILNQNAFDTVLNNCESKAISEVNWPGDHRKNTRYLWKYKIKSLSCYIAPTYKFIYEFEGEKYSVKGFAFGKLNEVHKTPVSKKVSTTIRDTKNNAKAKLAGENQKRDNRGVLYPFLAILCGLAGLISCVCVAGFEHGFIPLIVGGILIGLMVLFIIFWAVNKNKLKKNINTIEKDRDSELDILKNEKLLKLEKFLKENNMDELSDFERNFVLGIRNYEEVNREEEY